MARKTKNGWGGKRKGAGVKKGTVTPGAGRKHSVIKLRKHKSYQVVSGDGNAEVWQIIDVKANGLTFEKPDGETLIVKVIN